MTTPTQYRVNRPKVIFETFDDEAVIVHLDSGNYYSVDAIGLEVWALIEKGLTHQEMIDTLACRYEGQRDQVEAGIGRFVAELVAESLVVPAAGTASEVSSLPSYNTAYGPEKRIFRPPVLQKFTDMQELLLLDPIHEVDASGWPHPAKPETEALRKVG